MTPQEHLEYCNYKNELQRRWRAKKKQENKDFCKQYEKKGVD
jgi:hypothetical protein